MSFRSKLASRIQSAGTRLCVGLDVRATDAGPGTKDLLLRIIEETAPFAAAFKPNSAYFEALGWRGMRLLEEVLATVPESTPIVLDVKRGDIGETQTYYAKACFDQLRADAVTLNPYMGSDTLEPFLAREGKGIYLLGVTSNPGASDIELQPLADAGRRVFELAAAMTSASPEVGLVVGLTNAAGILDRIPDVPLLIPGLGAQGGDLAALRGSTRSAPLLVNVSRGILQLQPGETHAGKAAHWAAVIEEALSAPSSPPATQSPGL
jgi:orotidine-5'-phosphate decarboxylase